MGLVNIVYIKYHLVLGPLCWKCPHHRALPYTVNFSQLAQFWDLENLNPMFQHPWWQIGEHNLNDNNEWEVLESGITKIHLERSRLLVTVHHICSSNITYFDTCSIKYAFSYSCIKMTRVFPRIPEVYKTSYGFTEAVDFQLVHWHPQLPWYLEPPTWTTKTHFIWANINILM